MISSPRTRVNASSHASLKSSSKSNIPANHAPTSPFSGPACPVCKQRHGPGCFTNGKGQAFCGKHTDGPPQELDGFQFLGTHGDNRYGVYGPHASEPPPFPRSDLPTIWPSPLDPVPSSKPSAIVTMEQRQVQALDGVQGDAAALEAQKAAYLESVGIDPELARVFGCTVINVGEQLKIANLDEVESDLRRAAQHGARRAFLAQSSAMENKESPPEGPSKTAAQFADDDLYRDAWLVIHSCITIHPKLAHRIRNVNEWSQNTCDTGLDKTDKCGKGGVLCGHIELPLQMFLAYNCHSPDCDHCMELKRRWFYRTFTEHSGGLLYLYTAKVAQEQFDTLTHYVRRKGGHYCALVQADGLLRVFSSIPFKGAAERTRDEALDLFLTACFAMPRNGGRLYRSSDDWSLLDERSGKFKRLHAFDRLAKNSFYFFSFMRECGISPSGIGRPSYTAARKVLYDLSAWQLHVLELRFKAEMPGTLNPTGPEYEALRSWASDDVSDFWHFLFPKCQKSDTAIAG